MTSPITLKDIGIRTELKPGDIGYIVHRHGVIYQQEYDYGIEFESYVAKGMHEFFERYDPKLDSIWLAEHDHRFAGFLLLMHRDAGSAQLRYFLIEPEYRGIGLGKKLMQLYVEFLHERNYRHSYLWTTKELHTAAVLYRQFGFQLTEEKASASFGKEVIEQRYDLIVS